jgi:hypothetical protein
VSLLQLGSIYFPGFGLQLRNTGLRRHLTLLSSIYLQRLIIGMQSIIGRNFSNLFTEISRSILKINYEVA